VVEVPGNPATRYKKRFKRVHAVCLHHPLKIVLSDDRGSLHGEPGAWCVWHEPTDITIVEHDIFLETYQLATIPVYVDISNDLADVERANARATLHALTSLLKHTELVVVERAHNHAAQSDPKIWFKVVQQPPAEPEKIMPTLEVPYAKLSREAGRDGLWALLDQALRGETWWTYTEQAFRSLSGRLRRISQQEDDVFIVADQLAAVDRFNQTLVHAHAQSTNSDFLKPCPGDLAPEGAARILEIGIIADRNASKYQTLWQRLVLATTAEIANAYEPPEPRTTDRETPLQHGLKHRFNVWYRRVLAMTLLLLRPSLTTFGLLAALALVGFTELSNGCTKDDPFSAFGCDGSTWKTLAGPIYFSLYVIGLGCAWVRFATARSKKWQERHFDLRLLAECLRVQYVMAALGEKRCVADYLPLMDHAESSWVRLSLRSIYYAQRMSPREKNAPIEDWAMKEFVNDQLAYHRTKLISRRKNAFRMLEWFALLAASIFILMIFLLAVDLFVQYGPRNSAPRQMLSEAQGFASPYGHHLLIVIQVFALAVWGAMRKVSDTFGLEQEIHRGLLVQHKLKVAQGQGNADPARAILHVCDYFIRDQAAWHALHRGKPIDVTTGG
jgi:hypothetical protein